MTRSHNGSNTFWMPPGQAVPVGLEITCSTAGVTGVRFASRSKHPNADSATGREFARTHSWFGPALAALQRYLDGAPVDLATIPIDLSSQPPFRRRVQEACRRIAFGRTQTYADLARQVRAPGAARAVGSAMSHNPVPLLVPCHRVVRADGGLGGFSGPGGVSLKADLLRMERGSGGEAVRAPRLASGT
ncbi:MAG TPA: methylated-DNA--[protein]-cysteine S-methyltransferase [Gemmatales bacterium]|nr:methylated-DNA--[protein]-cysteine S-methyltransferase [Gemmatales bacterium]HMP61289.1 methylated-DNA--[protein]-cysteine S-methyltransferase [Gemmatales bacterium]